MRRLVVLSLFAASCGAPTPGPEGSIDARALDGSATGADADAAPATSCSSATPSNPYTLLTGLGGPAHFIVDGDRLFVATDAHAPNPIGRILSIPSDGGPVREIASDLRGTHMLAADGGYLYVSSEDFIRPLGRMLRDGGPMQTVYSATAVYDIAATGGHVYAAVRGADIIDVDAATGQSTTLVGSGLFAPSGLHVDDAYLYYMNASGRFGARVERVPIAGGPVEMVAIGQPNIFTLAASNHRVAWTLGEPSTAILTRQKGDGPVPLWPSTIAHAMARYGDALYWAAEGRVDKHDLTTGQTTTLRTDVIYSAGGMAVDGTDIYLLKPSFDEPQSNTFTPGELYRMPRDGSAPPTRIGGDVWNINAMESDGTHLYWTTSGQWPAYLGGVVRYNKATGAIDVVVSDQQNATGLALDDTNVYWWSVAASTLRTAPKAGGAVSILAMQVGDYPSDFVRTPDGTLYWSDRVRGIRAYRNGQVVDIATGSYTFTDFVIAGDQVFYQVQMALTARFRRAIMVAPLAGGAARMIASDMGTSMGFAVHDDDIYWLDFNAMLVFRAPIAGSAADFVVQDLALPFGLALTDDATYWASGPSIWRQRLLGGVIETIVTEPSGVGAVVVSDDTLYWGAASSIRCATIPP